jgi:cytochrome b subunit of formate dehydrogenase
MSVKVLIQTTKGIIRDQSVRRTVMFVIVLAALLMVFAGMTFLSGWLAGDKWTFLIYWVACAWLAMTSILLAIFDLLAVQLLLRRERKRIKKDIFGKEEDGERD